MDVTHKAGKALHKAIPLYYQANPEFGSKSAAAASTMSSEETTLTKPKAKKGKKVKQLTSGETEELDAAQVQKQLQEERTAKLLATGGEINLLDAVAMPLTD